MKRDIKFGFALLGLFVAFALTGCETLLGQTAKSKASAAVKSADLVETAGIGAAAASGDYKKAFDGVVAYAKRVKAAQAKANGAEITKAEVASAMKKDGFSYVKEVYYDGIIVNELKKITWAEKWVKTGSGEDASIEVIVDSGDGSTLEDADDESEEIDWMDVIIKQAEEQGIKLE